MQVPTSEKWRDANKPVKTVFGLNPKLIFVFLIGFFVAKYFPFTSLTVSVGLTVFFSIIERRGITVGMAMRLLRTKLCRNHKRLWPTWVKR